MNKDISQILEEYSDMAFRLILRIVADRETALDLTQEMFVKLYEKPAYLKSVDNIRGYILKTAYHQALNHRRDTYRQRAKEQDFCSTPRQQAATPEEELAKAEQARIFGEYLKELSPQQRDAVLCRFYGEMKLNEIARQLNISEATVRIHLQRALEKMKNKITAGQEG